MLDWTQIVKSRKNEHLLVYPFQERRKQFFGTLVMVNDEMHNNQRFYPIFLYCTIIYVSMRIQFFEG